LHRDVIDGAKPIRQRLPRLGTGIGCLLRRCFALIDGATRRLPIGPCDSFALPHATLPRGGLLCICRVDHKNRKGKRETEG
jgi:hypothetical protein